MAKEIVIFPGGYHPFSPGHLFAYNTLRKAFPSADLYVASSDSTSERPFPYEDKKVLAVAAGIPTDKFVEVKSPYKAEEITKDYNPEKDVLVFGLSAKDANRLSYVKKDGTPGYFQKYKPGIVMDTFDKHAYVYITPTVSYKVMGKDVTSASIIRKMYGEADDKGKIQILKELYPKASPQKLKPIFDKALMTSEAYMPARYKAGLSPSTAEKRKVFWKKLGKYPFTKSEYEKAKDAPGDTKKTHPSKYTVAYKKKFGEDMIQFNEFLSRLEEDYKTSEKRFLDQGANPEELKAAIEFHKANKNTFKPEWKNIDAIKDWKAFQEFIKDQESQKKVKQSFKKEQDQVTLRDDDQWLILVPLDHKTSCFHGSDTDWCTTKADKEYFSEYFFEAGVILVYCLKKNETKDKWAIALHLDHLDKSEFFDKKDKSINQFSFKAQTGLNFEDIVNGVKANQDYIQKKREENQKKDLNFLLKQTKETGKPNKDLENLISVTKNTKAAYYYALDVLKGPFKLGEPVIAKDPRRAYYYAHNVLEGPFKLGEPEIAKDPEWAFRYALDVLKGPFKLAEPVIAKSPEWAYNYALDVLKGPFKLGEPVIAKDPMWAYNYALDVLKGPFKLGEPVIAKDFGTPMWAYNYAHDVLKDKAPKTWAKRYLAGKTESVNESTSTDTALVKKSKDSGIPKGILRKVYNRGLAAWVTGHRPGASQAAWGMARVNSFILKGKTWYGPDSDLAAKAKAAKKAKKEEVEEHIVHSKKGWTLYSKKTHKRLGGPYPTKAQAEKRERQVQYFKHMHESFKSFKDFLKEDEEHPSHLDPKGDQQILLEVEIPAEVKQNVDDGLDLLKQNNNKGANSSLIDFAKKITSGRQADRDMLELWQGKFKIHQSTKDHGWGKMSDKDLNALLAKEVPAGYIPWMLLGGDEGKKFVDETLAGAK